MEALKGALERSIRQSEVKPADRLPFGADELSDIELSWVVPDDSFEPALDVVGRIASHALALVAVDPRSAGSPQQRRFLLQFKNLPLFWRINLKVRCDSAPGVEDYDPGMGQAHSEDGSDRAARALMNAMAAVRALRLGQVTVADRLIQESFECLEHPVSPAWDPARALHNLVQACQDQDPTLQPVVAGARELIDVMVPPRSVARLDQSAAAPAAGPMGRYGSAYDFHVHWWIRAAAWTIAAVVLTRRRRAAILLAPLPLEGFLLGATWWRRRRRGWPDARQ